MAKKGPQNKRNKNKIMDKEPMGGKCFYITRSIKENITALKCYSSIFLTQVIWKLFPTVILKSISKVQTLIFMNFKRFVVKTFVGKKHLPHFSPPMQIFQSPVKSPESPRHYHQQQSPLLDDATFTYCPDHLFTLRSSSISLTISFCKNLHVYPISWQ